MKDLLAGRIDVYCEPATGTTANIQAGKIKPYAVTTKRRVATLPDVPTTAEAGFPEIGITTWYGLYAPKGTPAAAIDKLATALQAALKDNNVVTRFAQLSMEPVPQDQATPAALAAKLRVGSEVLVGASQGSRGPAGIAIRCTSVGSPSGRPLARSSNTSSGAIRPDCLPLAGPGLRRHMVGRRRSCRMALDFHRDDGATDLLGMQVARHLAEVPPGGAGCPASTVVRTCWRARSVTCATASLSEEPLADRLPRSGMLATNRPSLSRSIVAQYQILYIRLSPHASTRAAPSIVPRSREKTDRPPDRSRSLGLPCGS